MIPLVESRPQTSPLILPTGLIFLAGLWLVGSWLLTVGLQMPLQPTSASFEPSLRLLLQSIVVGFVVGWPLLRLSQERFARPIGQVWLDMLVLGTLLQVVIWLPRLFTSWTVPRTIALDLTLLGWMALVGALIAAATGTNRLTPRLLVMATCLGACLIGPLAGAGGRLHVFDAHDLVLLGPVAVVRALTDSGATLPSTAQWSAVMLIGLIALGVWCVLLIASHFFRGNESGQ
ncbi:MAG: hypothetical protein EA377_02415 [Phycisphaerales bacterium]|nr:MAG: hypothetical protein EA377_02415 [Phycisphaerales bacterium]